MNGIITGKVLYGVIPPFVKYDGMASYGEYLKKKETPRVFLIEFETNRPMTTVVIKNRPRVVAVGHSQVTVRFGKKPDEYVIVPHHRFMKIINRYGNNFIELSQTIEDQFEMVFGQEL